MLRDENGNALLLLLGNEFSCSSALSSLSLTTKQRAVASQLLGFNIGALIAAKFAFASGIDT